jgi:beta-lactamase class D
MQKINKVVTTTNDFSMEDDPVMKRVNEQLTYLTESLDLSPQEQKNWFYRLRREERELDKQQKVQEKLNAKRNLKRMIKKLKIPHMKKLGKK